MFCWYIYNKNRQECDLYYNSELCFINNGSEKGYYNNKNYYNNVDNDMEYNQNPDLYFNKNYNNNTKNFLFKFYELFF